jgi:glycosyltransferase involved in cell wall biosynthesis
MPRVSIGLPVYNGEKYLKETLDALLAQTFRDFELVIADNASTDATGEICRSYAAVDPRIRYHRNSVNLGAGRNYNLVVELARGELFKWSAHDDVCAPTFLERCVAALDADPGAVLAFTEFIDIDDGGKVLPVRAKSHVPLSRRAVHPRPWQRFRRLTQFDYTCEEVFGLIRMGTLRKTRLIMSYTDSDRTLLAELGLHGRFAVVLEPLWLHRLHKGSSTEVYADWFARAAWFDPAKKGKIVFPLWRQMAELAKAVLKTRIGVRERVLCYAWQGVWMFRLRGELWAETREGGRQFIGKLRGQVPGSGPTRETPAAVISGKHAAGGG